MRKPASLHRCLRLSTVANLFNLPRPSRAPFATRLPT
jgi:hypothetical protein